MLGCRNGVPLWTLFTHDTADIIFILQTAAAILQIFGFITYARHKKKKCTQKQSDLQAADAVILPRYVKVLKLFLQLLTIVLIAHILVMSLRHQNQKPNRYLVIIVDVAGANFVWHFMMVLVILLLVQRSSGAKAWFDARVGAVAFSIISVSFLTASFSLSPWQPNTTSMTMEAWIHLLLLIAHVIDFILICGVIGYMVHVPRRRWRVLIWYISYAFVLHAAWLAADFIRIYGNTGFCAYFLVDVFRSLSYPWLVFFTVRKDSQYWRKMGKEIVGTNLTRPSIWDSTLDTREHLLTFDQVESVMSMRIKILDWAHLDVYDDFAGSGATALVYKGVYLGVKVAVKCVLCDDLDLKTVHGFAKEALLSSRLKHRHIVRFYGVAVRPPELCLVYEYCSLTSLTQVLRNPNYILTYSQILQIAYEIALGMKFLHDEGIVHRDLKSDNVLLHELEEGQLIAKVCDFGLARSVASSDRSRLDSWDRVKERRMTTEVGTLTFMAPEILQNISFDGVNMGMASIDSQKTSYAFSVDVFSYGVILWELISRDEAYKMFESAEEIQISVLAGERPSIPNFCPQEYAGLIENCWDSDPVKRPSFTYIGERLQRMQDLPRPQLLSYELVASEAGTPQASHGSGSRDGFNRPYRLATFSETLKGDDLDDDEPMSIRSPSDVDRQVSDSSTFGPHFHEVSRTRSSTTGSHGEDELSVTQTASGNATTFGYFGTER